ncbi:DUF1771-domain-containing protein [Powellomyces hirtus]|nr:DUF1771-domain-containing protein [Powellomyces hirtus]KAI8913005.1 DUF1771-domain-containing protein [Powellomyces hirtus]
MGSHLSHHHPASAVPSESADSYRQKATHQAELRNDCYRRSQRAFQTGDKALAKELSTEGKLHAAEMDKYNELAASTAFAQCNPRNKGSSTSLSQLDLHGLFVKEALAKLEIHVRECRKAGVKTTTVITGRGSHSKDGIAKIKPAVEEFLKRERIKAIEDARNPGSVTLELDVPEGAAVGWFHSHCLIQ